MKKPYHIIGLGILVLLVGMMIFQKSESGKRTIKQETIRIGVSLYRFDDTFISEVKREMENYVKEYEKKHKRRVNLEILDAAGSQIIQNKQIDRFVSLKYDVLLINPVERADASTMIDKALRADIPVVFFNREPVEDDMKRADRLYYVGASAKESAILEGEILVESYKKNKRILDLNGDGLVGYVLLEGEPSHQDSLIRTEWSTKTVKEGGVPIIKLAGGVANWERNQAAALVEGWLSKYGDEIELVLSNNDDMALGAIDALEAAGKAGKVKVVGIDGTEEALAALEKGTLLGTVSNDRADYAGAILEIALAKLLKEELPFDIKERMEREKYYFTKQFPVTKQ